MKTINTMKLLDVREGAIYLLGCVIKRTLPSGEVLSAKIVETESYHQDDPASHTFSGKSLRNSAMFGPPGYAYIYFTYGMHWCFNVTAGSDNYGAGILIRAVEPLQGTTTMQQNRGFRARSVERKKSLHDLTNGPAKLAQALDISKKLYGHDLQKPPLQIFEPASKDFEVVQTTRIGISKAVEEVARFYIKGNEFVSKR